MPKIDNSCPQCSEPMEFLSSWLEGGSIVVATECSCGFRGTIGIEGFHRAEFWDEGYQDAQDNEFENPYNPYSAEGRAWSSGLLQGAKDLYKGER